MSYEHLIAAAAAQKMANPDIPLAAYDAGFSSVKANSNTTQTSLCLSNLPFTYKEEEIAALFDNVVNVNILRHRDTNRPRGMAIVQFSDATHCNIAYDLVQSQHVEAGGRVVRGDYNKNDRSQQQYQQQPQQASGGYRHYDDGNQSSGPGQQHYQQHNRDGPPRGDFSSGGRSRFDQQPQDAQAMMSGDGHYDTGGGSFHHGGAPRRGFGRDNGGGGGGYRGGRGGGGGYQNDRRGFNDGPPRGGGGGYQDRGGRGGGGYQDRSSRGGGYGYEDNGRGGGGRGFHDQGGYGGDRRSEGYNNDRRGGGGGYRGGNRGGAPGNFRDRSHDAGPRPSKYGVTSACVRELPSSGRPQRSSSSSSNASN